MMTSFWSGTIHVKIVAISLTAAAALTIVGMSARVADSGLGTDRSFPLRQEEVPLVLALQVLDPAARWRPQAWPNTDRHCLSRTSPHTDSGVVTSGASDNAITRLPEVASVLLQADRDTATPPPPREESALLYGSAVQPLAAELRPMPHRAISRSAPARPQKSARRNSERARVAQRADDGISDLPVSAFARETRRTAVRPTKPHHLHYYSSRPWSRQRSFMAFDSSPGRF
jgi:hypothetical protein